MFAYSYYSFAFFFSLGFAFDKCICTVPTIFRTCLDTCVKITGDVIMSINGNIFKFARAICYKSVIQLFSNEFLLLAKMFRVLHMDRNDYYGGESTSLNLIQARNINREQSIVHVCFACLLVDMLFVQWVPITLPHEKYISITILY